MARHGASTISSVVHSGKKTSARGNFISFIFSYFISISSVCAETAPTDANCVSEWVRLNDAHDIYGTLQASASTIEECEQACEFDPGCVAVYFWSDTEPTVCYLTTDPSYVYRETKVAHYRLVSPCGVASGQCLDNNTFLQGVSVACCAEALYMYLCVCPSHCDSIKTVLARITKSLLSAATKTFSAIFDVNFYRSMLYSMD